MEEFYGVVGAFGKYQKLQLIFLGTVSALSAAIFFSTVFIGAEPELICSSGNNTTNQNLTTCEIWSNVTLSQQRGVETEHECRFDKKHYGKTIINQWGLVCDKFYMTSMIDSIYMIGSFSSLFIGFLSDKWGRKTTCLVCVIVLTIVQALNAVLQMPQVGLSNTTQYVVYTASRLLVGIFNNSLFCVNYILVVELTTKKYKTFVSNILLIAFVAGELLVLVVAYYSRDWHIMLWFLVAFSLLALSFVLGFLPESPSYLFETKQYDRIRKLAKQIARINGRAIYRVHSANETEGDTFINKRVADSSEQVNDSLLDKLLTANHQLNSVDADTPKEKTGLVQFVLESKWNLINSALLAYLWFDLSLIYYGISLGITYVGHMDPYLIYLSSSIAELIGYTLFYLERFGQKRMFIIYLVLSCVSCAAVAFVPDKTKASHIEDTTSLNSILLIVFVSIGKTMISAAFASAYMYTAMFIPVKIRSTMLLLFNSVGRIGSILAPQVNLLGHWIWHPLPYIIFSISSSLSALFVFILPDPSTLIDK